MPCGPAGCSPPADPLHLLTAPPGVPPLVRPPARRPTPGARRAPFPYPPPRHRLAQPRAAHDCLRAQGGQPQDAPVLRGGARGHRKRRDRRHRPEHRPGGRRRRQRRGRRHGGHRRHRHLDRRHDHHRHERHRRQQHRRLDRLQRRRLDRIDGLDGRVERHRRHDRWQQRRLDRLHRGRRHRGDRRRRGQGHHHRHHRRQDPDRHPRPADRREPAAAGLLRERQAALLQGQEVLRPVRRGRGARRHLHPLRRHQRLREDGPQGLHRRRRGRHRPDPGVRAGPAAAVHEHPVPVRGRDHRRHHRRAELLRHVAHVPAAGSARRRQRQDPGLRQGRREVGGRAQQDPELRGREGRHRERAEVGGHPVPVLRGEQDRQRRRRGPASSTTCGPTAPRRSTSSASPPSSSRSSPARTSSCTRPSGPGSASRWA